MECVFFADWHREVGEEMALIRFLGSLLITYTALLIVCVFAVCVTLVLLFCLWGVADIALRQVAGFFSGKI